MSAVSAYEEHCQQALIRCARICCICRRFRPSHIQVHHIVERSEGGTDEFDNLIPACIFCHQGHVHATVPFTQRFSAQELKGLRDHVYALVADGKLVPPDADSDTSMSQSAFAAPSSPPVRTSVTIADGRFTDPDLPPEATGLVVAMAASGNGHLVVKHCVAFVMLFTDSGIFKNRLTGRDWALYQDILGQLAAAGVLRQLAPHLYELTWAGYMCADAFASGAAP